jgi:hypothetical protein
MQIITVSGIGGDLGDGLCSQTQQHAWSALHLFRARFCISKRERSDVLRPSSAGCGFDGRPAWRVLFAKPPGSPSNVRLQSLRGAAPSNERARSPDAEFKNTGIKKRLSCKFKQFRSSWLMLLQHAPRGSVPGSICRHSGRVVRGDVQC